MLGLRYFRHAGPNDPVARYVGRRLRSQGRGLSFRVGPRTTISFGQGLVAADLERAFATARACEIFVAASTSLVVGSINQMFAFARRVAPRPRARRGKLTKRTRPLS